MAQRELILRLRELGDGMEQALNDDAFARMHNISAAMAAASMPSDDGLSRPTAAAVFWPETVRAVGALLQESQTAKLQRDQLFQTVRMWEEHKPVDLESPRNEQVNITSNFNACQVRSDMRARAHRLADIHATMTNHKDWVAMVSSTLGIEVAGLEDQLCAAAEREAQMVAELGAMTAQHASELASRDAELARLRRSIEEMRLQGDRREERIKRGEAMLQEERAAAATAQGVKNAAHLAQLAQVQSQLATALARVLQVEGEVEVQGRAAQAEMEAQGRAARAEMEAQGRAAQAELVMKNAAHLKELAQVQGGMTAALARVTEVEGEVEVQKRAAHADIVQERARGVASSVTASLELQNLEHEAADEAAHRQRLELQAFEIQHSLREAHQASHAFSESVPARVRERLNQLISNPLPSLPSLPPLAPNVELPDWRRTSSVVDILAGRGLSATGAALLEDGMKATIRKMLEFVSANAAGDDLIDEATSGHRSAAASAGRAARMASLGSAAAGGTASADIGFSGWAGADVANTTAALGGDWAVAMGGRSDGTPGALCGDAWRNAGADGALATGPTDGSTGAPRYGDGVSGEYNTGWAVDADLSSESSSSLASTASSAAASGIAPRAARPSVGATAGVGARSRAGSEGRLGTSSGGGCGSASGDASRASSGIGSCGASATSSRLRRDRPRRVSFARETEKLVKDVTSVTMTELEGADSVDNIAIQLNAYQAVAKLLEEEVALLRADIEAAAEDEARRDRGEAKLSVAPRFKRRGKQRQSAAVQTDAPLTTDFVFGLDTLYHEVRATMQEALAKADQEGLPLSTPFNVENAAPHDAHPVSLLNTRSQFCAERLRALLRADLRQLSNVQWPGRLQLTSRMATPEPTPTKMRPASGWMAVHTRMPAIAVPVAQQTTSNKVQMDASSLIPESVLHTPTRSLRMAKQHSSNSSVRQSPVAEVRANTKLPALTQPRSLARMSSASSTTNMESDMMDVSAASSVTASPVQSRGMPSSRSSLALSSWASTWAAGAGESPMKCKSPPSMRVSSQSLI